MRLFIRAWLAILAVAAPAFGASGDQSSPRAEQSLTVSAAFAPRASVQVSNQVLQFDVIDASLPVDASIEFEAGARTGSAGHVLLVFDADLAVPGGTLAIAGGSDGTVPGLVTRSPTVVARWVGSGLRAGRIVFRLQAAPGRYEIPLRFRLETP